MTRRRVGRGYLHGAAAAIMAASLVLVGCGSAASNDRSNNGSVKTLDDVYATVEGLTGDARYQKLLSLAKAEGAQMGLYAVGNTDALNKAFTQKTGVKVTLFKGNSEQLSERVLSEHAANKVNSDVLIGSPNDLQPLSGKGVLAALTSPVLQDLDPGFYSKNWLEPDTVLELGSWNTDKVAPGDVPQSYEDLFTKFKGKIGVEATDWAWYYHIVTDYFMKQKGMTQEAAMQMITNGLKGATIVSGHTLLATLLASGEFDYTPHGFAHTITDLAKKGAPVTFGQSQPPGMPAFLSGHAYGISQGAPHPATALLYIEFAMSQTGQEAIHSVGNQVLSKKYVGDTLLTTTFTNYIDQTIGIVGTSEQQADWQTKYNDLLKSIGTEIRKS